MSKGGSRRPTTGGEGQRGGFVAGDNPYREPYSNPYRQGGFRVPMGQSGDYSRAGQRSGSLGNKGGQQRPPYIPSPYERQPQYNEGPRFPSRGNAKGGIGGMAPPPSSRYNPQRPDYTAQPYRPTTPNFRQIGRDALANTSSGGFGSSPNPPPQENLMQPAVQPPMNPSKGGNYRPMPAPVQQPVPDSRPSYIETSDDLRFRQNRNLRPAVQPPMSPSKGGTQQQKGGYNFAGQYDPNMPSGYGTDYQTFGGPRPEPVQEPMPDNSAFSDMPVKPTYSTQDMVRWTDPITGQQRSGGSSDKNYNTSLKNYFDNNAGAQDYYNQLNSSQQPMPAPVAPRPMRRPDQQPQPAMMPSKGGMNLPVPQPMPAPPSSLYNPQRATLLENTGPQPASPQPVLATTGGPPLMPAMMPSKGGMPVAQFNPQPVPPIQSPSFTPSRQIRSPLGPRNMRYGR